MSSEEFNKTERLNEVILDLERSKIKEEALREESDGLLKALQALISSSDEDVIFSELLNNLQDVLDYHQAFILIKEADKYEVKYATKTHFVDTSWEEGNFFKKVAIGKPLAVFNIEQIPEWKQQPESITKNVTSALHIPLTGKEKKALLICTHNEIGFFSQKHQALALKFVPIATQALILLETNQNLKEEVKERKKVELELIKVQSELVKKAYTEGFAKNAIDILHSIGNALTPLLVYTEDLKNDTALSSLQTFIGKFEGLIKNHHEKKTLVEYFNNDKNTEKIIKSFNMIHTQLDEYLNRREKGFENIYSYADKIRQAVDSQQQFVDLRESKQYETNINKILNEIIEHEKHDAKGLHVEVNNEILNEEAIVNVEPNTFHHTIVNLIYNALEAFEESHILDKKIHIKTEVEDNYVKITIVDNGCGIEDVSEEKLFKFGYTTKEGRAGFGLHNTANFIKASNGNIEVSSEGKNKGTKVIVTLPLLVI